MKNKTKYFLLEKANFILPTRINFDIIKLNKKCKSYICEMEDSYAEYKL